MTSPRCSHVITYASGKEVTCGDRPTAFFRGSLSGAYAASCERHQVYMGHVEGTPDLPVPVTEDEFTVATIMSG